eukprot:403333575
MIMLSIILINLQQTSTESTFKLPSKVGSTGFEKTKRNTDEMLLVISVDGTLQALDKTSGEQIWKTQLEMPMIGSYEFDNKIPSEDAFVPLVDGSLVRFDKEGFLERTTYNVRDQDLPNFFNKNQCLVTGQTKTTAIQIDLSNGKIIQTVGADLSTFQGFKKKQPTETNDNNSQSESRHQSQSSSPYEKDPFWLVMKNYDYLSYDHQNGMTQWSIFYSEFSNDKTRMNQQTNKQSTELSSSFFNPQREQSIFANGNILYSITLNNQNQPIQNWIYQSVTPVYQVLNINRQTDEVSEVPFNELLERDINNIKLINIENYLYADHSYKFIPAYKKNALDGASEVQRRSNELSLLNPNYQELKVPIKNPDVSNLDEIRMIDDLSQQTNNIDVIFSNYSNEENSNTKNETKSIWDFFLKIEFIVFIGSLCFIVWIMLKLKLIKIGFDSHTQQQSTQNEIKVQEEVKPIEPIIKEVIKEVLVVKEPERKIQINDKVILGLGSGGTVVFEAHQEVQFLQKVDLHPNVITYYDKEEDKDFVYLAIEKCEGNLENLVELMKAVTLTEESEWKNLPLAQLYLACKNELHEPASMIQIMQQSLRGLKFLHDNNIVHRDIKPHNLLLNKLKCVKLSDMGLSKQLFEDQLSYHTEVKGSLGWQAPEVIHSEKEHKPMKTTLQKTFKVDIFSMGCVFYYLLSKGHHPFGQRFEREKNILNGKFNISQILEQLTYERSREAENLIALMIQQDPKKRPTATQLLAHIFFWSNDKKLKLIQDLSDKLEFNNQANSDLIQKLETLGTKHNVLKLCLNNWTTLLHPSLIQELQKWRKYNYQSLTDLLRFIRNKKNHFRELPEVAKQFLGNTNDTYMRYFTKLYPNMMLAVDEYVRKNLLNDPLFAQYYDINIII